MAEPTLDLDAIRQTMASTNPDGPYECVEALVAEVERLRKELHRWRDWAQFVYLGGGPLCGDDDMLRSRVCETHDQETDDLKTEIAAAEAERDHLRQQLLKLAEHWRSERGHTYASENADLYRGFENGRQRCASEIEKLAGSSPTPETK